MSVIGAVVRSNWNPSIVGTVVGFGSLMWPSDKDQSYDAIIGDSQPKLVYLVQQSPGSNALKPACIVLRADRVTILGEP
jgi:hypothetical protein